MSLRHLSNTLFFLLLMTGLIVAGPAFAQDPIPIIDSANPSSAVQGTSDLSVEILGSDLGPGATVFFCEKTDAPYCDTNAYGISVGEVRARGKTKLLVTVSIDEISYVGDIDIGVEYSSGRKGKGTSKFSVQAKVTGNMEFETCNEVFFPGDETEPCKSVDGGECELLLGNPSRIKRMMTDCTITKTLVLPDSVLLTSASAQESGTDRKTLRAWDSPEDPWEGAAVITNAGHRAQLGNIDIEIDTAAANGCNGQLHSAVSFVLHNLDDTTDPPNPYPNKKTLKPYNPEDESTYDGRASIFQVDGVDVRTGTSGGPLCTAVELIRDPSYTEAYPELPPLNINDWKVRVTGGRIYSGTYVDTAISLEGFKQQQDINPPTVSGNTIYAPDCEAGDPAAFGIVHGPLIARDNAVPQSEALLENNTIFMSGSECETMGILLLGGTDTEIVGNINSNYIDGATYGVVIDGTVDVDSANLKGNTLMGEIGVSAVGICSDIPFDEKGKPNQISGFSTAEADDCSP